MTKRLISMIMTFILSVTLLGAFPAAAANGSLVIKCSINYDLSYDALQYINAYREKNGLSALTMDKGLMNNALQRAAEISVKFDHFRPDGRGPFDGLSYGSSCGENIAYGQTSGDEVSTAWINSAPHRANILQSDFVSTGLVCVYANGDHFWVQVFDNDDPDYLSKPSNTTKSFTINVSDDFSYLYPSGDMTITKCKRLGKNAIRLEWSKVSNIDGFRLYRRVNGGKYKAIASLDPSTTKYTDSSLNTGSKYTYYIKSFKVTDSATGWSAPSEKKTVKLVPSTTKFTKARSTKNTVKLVWKKVACNGYRVYMYDPAKKKKYKYVKQIKSTAKSCKVTGLKRKTYYRFKVKAYYTDSVTAEKFFGKASKAVKIKTK